MEVEVEQLQQARALAASQQTAKQMASDLDRAWAVQRRDSVVAQERQEQVSGQGGGGAPVGCSDDAMRAGRFQ